jgi:hypothetical protein
MRAPALPEDRRLEVMMCFLVQDARFACHTFAGVNTSARPFMQ